MEVTHLNKTVTHAVIGNKAARDFSISNSAEFFNILSNTLYSDKILAFCREILCNAWDIHIQTGKTDTPVEVTLTNNKLTVRDFGIGIHDDDMHPIYATYGNSTKKLDGEQTGGFGLGSKSPFAYVDHFEVISYHEMRKTVYAISKSSAEVAGKPSLTPLLSIPTTEVGLSVSLEIQENDMRRVRDVIHMLARFGEMNVEYNGIKLPTIAFSQAAHGFVITKDVTNIPGAGNQHVFVRYGNVVYPIPDHQDIGILLHRSATILDKIGSDRWNRSGSWNLIIQAKPNTISVTPSRESLSMTENTVESLNELLTNFCTYYENADFKDVCIELQEAAIAKMWSHPLGMPVNLLTSDNTIPALNAPQYGAPTSTIEDPDIITDGRGMATAMMHRRYPQWNGFKTKDTQMRIAALIKHEFGGKTNRGKLQSFLRATETQKEGNYNSTWFQRFIAQPLIRKIEAVPELSASKLFVYGNNYTRDAYSGYNKRINFHNPKDISRRYLDGYWPFLRNIVVLSFNRMDVEERLGHHMRERKLGKGEEFFVYIVPRTDKKIEIIRSFFEKLGMVIVDLTKPASWETPEVIVPVSKPKVVKPRKKGLLRLDHILTVDSQNRPQFKHERLLDENCPRVENPQFVLKINPRAQSWDFGNVDLACNLKLAIVRTYGDKGGVVTNENQLARFTNDLKIPALRDWLLAKALNETLTNPRLQLAFGAKVEKFDPKIKILMSEAKVNMLNTILASPDLAIEFGVLNEMTEEDVLLLSIIEEMIDPDNHYSWRNNDQVEQMKTHIASVKVSPEVEAVASKISKSNLCGLFNTSLLMTVFSNKADAHQKKQRAGALDVLQYALA